ncbi:MAG: reverse transcriptase domain-containing protein [Oscillospiraceae bacterium]|jgi:RNA-directed DNA polymerase
MAIRKVFMEITSFHSLMIAEKEVSKGKREQEEVLIFQRDLEDRLHGISELLRSGKIPKVYYKSFLVYVPKVRKVIYIDYQSKIIQRAIYDAVNPKVSKMFITDTYSCIKGRGQVAAFDTLYGWIKATRVAEGEWYYYKFDVAKFFYRIDHEIMMDICRKKIDDPRTVELIEYYVCSTSKPFGLPLDADHLTITEAEMLWDVGIPIGGGLSHMLGNMYMDPLDQYAKRELGIKRYIRYMDDIIIVDNDKERLLEYGRKLTKFLEEKLLLKFNSKTAMRPVRAGCEFVGVLIYDDHAILRKTTSLRMKRRMREVSENYRDGKITFAEANATVQSYKAILDRVDCKNFREKLFKEFSLTRNPKNVTEEG